MPRSALNGPSPSLWRSPWALGVTSALAVGVVGTLILAPSSSGETLASRDMALAASVPGTLSFGAASASTATPATTTATATAAASRSVAGVSRSTTRATPSPVAAPSSTNPASTKDEAALASSEQRVLANPVTATLATPRSGGGTLTGSTSPGAPWSAGTSAAALRRVSVSTSAQLQSAIATARPGDWITLASGTYTGPFNLFTAGTAAHPVVMLPAAGASVTLTASLRMPSCNASGPDDNRTIRISRGASHWVIQGLDIVGGVMISSTGAAASNNWITAQARSHDWQARRAVPGRGTNDPSAASGAAEYLSKLTHTAITPSDDIQLIDNTITQKGVFSRFGRYGVLDGNTITNVACGTGPGVWLANYSDAWTVTANDVSAVGASTYSHFMQEGIRIGTASSYNHVYQNRVHDLPTQGRAFTTDVDASWNVYDHNTATNIDIGFNDQQSGWGNTWDHNTSTGARTASFSFRMKDGPLSVPSNDTSTIGAQVSCNVSNGSPRALQAGAMRDSIFRSNSFATVSLSPRLRGYWTAQGDMWNGANVAPSAQPKMSSSGC